MGPYGATWQNSQVCSDSGLVLIAEPLVNILVHQRSLSDSSNTIISAVLPEMPWLWKPEHIHLPAIAQNDNLWDVSVGHGQTYRLRRASNTP